MQTLGKLITAGILAFALLQFVRPSIPAKPATAEVQAPPEVKHVLETDCYSCHSDQRRLSWFDQIVPAYWLVRHDILVARQHLNFSTLGAKPAAAQKATLYEAVNMIQLGAMPPIQFRKLHPEANVTPDDLAVLKAFLAPWASEPQRPAVDVDTAPQLSNIQPELNEMSFDKSFTTWKLLSITDRGDNNTFRFILGNDLAMKAAQTGTLSPWPDGARFAKVAWQQESGADGLVHPGKFVQVELMEKDAGQYRNTEGWNWGRWRGLDLKPYGENADFVGECTSCHLPLRGNDYVYTLPISAARVTGREVVNNAAALPASLPYQPLRWNPITMYVDRKNHTMATLYADTAPPSARVLALVTWVQRDDPHWFGGRIPDKPRSVEFVQLAASGQVISYRRFAGIELTEDRASARPESPRASFILALPAAQLPKLQ